MPDRIDTEALTANGMPVVHEGKAPETTQEPTRQSPKTKQFRSLTEMAEEFELFCISAAIHCLGLPTDPIRDWIARDGLTDETAPWAIDFTAPLFAGLPDEYFIGVHKVRLNSRLYACPKESWEQCQLQIAGICVFKTELKFYARLAWHPLAILDRMQPNAAMQWPLPMLSIQSVAVASNQWTAMLTADGDPLKRLPSLRYSPADPTIVAEAGSVFSSTKTRL